MNRTRFEPDSERPRFFHTVRGIGYRFVSTGEESGS
jgi:DNA-binding response OmpR family regulator